MKAQPQVAAPARLSTPSSAATAFAVLLGGCWGWWTLLASAADWVFSPEHRWFGLFWLPLVSNAVVFRWATLPMWRNLTDNEPTRSLAYTAGVVALIFALVFHMTLLLGFLFMAALSRLDLNNH